MNLGSVDDELKEQKERLDAQAKKAEALKDSILKLADEIEEKLGDLGKEGATSKAADDARQKLGVMSSRVEALGNFVKKLEDDFKAYQKALEQDIAEKLSSSDVGESAKGTIEKALSTVPDAEPGGKGTCPPTASPADKGRAALATAKEALEVIKPKVPVDPRKIPKWDVFKPELNEAFIKVLQTFRETADLKPDFSGGESKIFTKPGEMLALKRWVGERFHQMEQSITLLRQMDEAINKNPELNKLMEVVKVHDQGPDWILRDFDINTAPLSDFAKDADMLAVRKEAIAALEKVVSKPPVPPTAEKVLAKLMKEPPGEISENIHWSEKRKKIVLIDNLDL